MTRFFRFLIVLAVCGLTAEAARADMIFDLEASNFIAATDSANAVWNSSVSYGGVTYNFNGSSLALNAWNPTATTISGVSAVNFSGVNTTMNGWTIAQKLESSPCPINGSHAWTTSMWVYNPSIQNEEDVFQWGFRNTGAGCAADLCYGSSASSGAYVHWASDSGYTKGTPAAGTWHYIALTYDGTTESLYVDGALDNSTARSLNLNNAINMILGEGFQEGSLFVNPSSLALGSMRMWDSALDATTIATTFNTEGVAYGVAVPEPSTLALLVGGLFGLLAYAWRRRK
jgi:hypothetical protein